MTTKIPYSKSYTEESSLIALLQSRGLSITDESKAQHYLTHIGYYRLSAYMYPLLCPPKEQHIYKKGTTFDKVMMLYRFDKKLRLLLFNEIEKIEVAVRSAVVKHGCEVTGDTFWMTNPSNFSNPVKFNKTLHLIDDELNHSKEEFITHFKDTYSDPYPPAWMLSEILPLGVITNIYSNIKNKKIKKRISQSFNLQIAPFESWMTIVTLTRNLCCYHARIWNKQNTLRPMMPNIIVGAWINLPTDTLRIYFDMCIIKYFLDIISPGNDMLSKMQSLFAEYPEVDLRALGFPSGDWQDEPLWSTQS
ncbi:Abi family protein [Prevotella sp. P2-180]|uniref:Abi family protein n=1 Tax=Prevotella sp. P2-180 TaxID=2024224 RepID=UPI000B95FF73|nr:Abi family protein [Prevotella sp. P2-180]OYP64519.1 CAAX protease [Prevotella sp. P2-180]